MIELEEIMKKIGVIVGSLRANSFNMKLAQHLASLFPKEYELEYIKIDDLPLYNSDIDTKDNAPTSYLRLRQKAAEMDAILIVSPEYNRSIPAALKNALDVGSRPISDNVWDGKPATIVTSSPGKIGGFGCSNHLKQVMNSLNMLVMASPEMYLGGITTILDQNGDVQDERTENFFKGFVQSFIEWIEKVS